jgi:hypothetical protein
MQQQVRTCCCHVAAAGTTAQLQLKQPEIQSITSPLVLSDTTAALFLAVVLLQREHM